MIPTTQRQWLVNGRPLGRALEPSDHKLVEAPVREPGEGEVLMRVLYLSFDPAQKSWIEQETSYKGQSQVGDVMPGYGVGEIVQSGHPDYRPGELVFGMPGWQEYATLSVEGLERVPEGVEPAHALAALGMTGKTAYLGLINIGKPKPGDTLVVSGAAGATGSLAGQIGKIAGCRVVGIAGGAEKCAMLTEQLGFDAAIDYKNEKVRSRLRETCPNGVDVFFDNVGGELLNDVLARMAVGARVVICGGISRYNADPRDPNQMPPGPRNYFNVVFTGATIQGFLLGHHERDFVPADRRLTEWLRSGAIKPKVDLAQGFENAPAALARIFDGKNLGKQLLKVG